MKKSALIVSLFALALTSCDLVNGSSSDKAADKAAQDSIAEVKAQQEAQTKAQAAEIAKVIDTIRGAIAEIRNASSQETVNGIRQRTDSEVKAIVGDNVEVFNTPEVQEAIQEYTAAILDRTEQLNTPTLADPDSAE